MAPYTYYPSERKQVPNRVLPCPGAFQEQFSKKEMFQPHLPVRLPCYDLAPVTDFAFDGITTGFGRPRLPWLDGRCVQGPGTYSPHHG